MSGRIRTIKPEVLDDEVASSLSDAAWRLWVSLWVLADDHGNVRLANKYLAASVWQDTSRDVETVRLELFEKGLVSPYAYKHQRYGHINGWEKHQRISNQGTARVPLPSQDDGTWGAPPLPTGLSVAHGFASNDSGRLPAVSPRVAANNSDRSTGRGSRILAAGSPTPTPTTDPERESDPCERAETLSHTESPAFEHPRESGVTRSALRAVEPPPSNDDASGARRDAFEDPTQPAAGHTRASAVVPRLRPTPRLEGAGIPTLVPDDLEPTDETVARCLQAGYPDPRPLMPDFIARQREKANQSASWQDSIFRWAGRERSFAPRSTGTYGAARPENPGPVNPSRRPPPKE